VVVAAAVAVLPELIFAVLFFPKIY